MSNRLTRVTFEVIVNGTVTRGRISSDECWYVAFTDCIEQHLFDFVIAQMLLDQMDHIYDSCLVASDIDRHEVRLNANRRLLYVMNEDGLINPDLWEQMKRLAEYERAIRLRADPV